MCFIKHFYPRSPCGERPTDGLFFFGGRNISIHALLAESDGIGLVFLWWGVRFLSTLSLRRATSAPRFAPAASRNFYPRSPCGERRKLNKPARQKLVFLSTLSLRRATANGQQERQEQHISIHALLAESDAVTTLEGGSDKDFYPRSPCGERQNAYPETRRHDVISIHALLAESDSRAANCQHLSHQISIHALLAESDARRDSRQQPAGISIHALLAESDRYIGSNIPNFAGISIHALLAESDDYAKYYIRAPEISIHALLAESDTYLSILFKNFLNFYPRSPCGERQTYIQDISL